MVDGSADTSLPRAIEGFGPDRAWSTVRPGRQPAVETAARAGDLPGYLAKLEASTGAALALLRRCIVEEQAPTRAALAAEAEFAFGLPSEAALTEIDQVAEMMGISSLR